jgi:(R,R)-butanediol dehydrogenase / meso-butanediol dehydrogenase / diacetyl reductase
VLRTRPGGPMKAAVVGRSRDVRVVELERPEPAVAEVLVDVACCGVCGSDLHMLSAGLVQAGHVLGHEFTGVVAGLGSGVTGWALGDRVAVLPVLACGQCYACRSGRPNLCQEQGIDHGPGIGRPGGYAESVTVPAGMLRHLPDNVSDAHGALAEPLAVALHAIRVSGAEPDEPVCVLGSGPIGVLTVAGLLASGYGRIAVVEPGPGRRAAVERQGVRALAPLDARAGVPRLLGGPPTTVIDSTGHPSAAPLALELLAPAGRLTVVGLPEDPATLDLSLIAFKEITIRGSLVYDERDFAAALAHLAAGNIPCDAIITAVAPLADAPSLIADLQAGATGQVKVLLSPGRPAAGPG